MAGHIPQHGMCAWEVDLSCSQNSSTSRSRSRYRCGACHTDVVVGVLQTCDMSSNTLVQHLIGLSG